MIPIGKVRDFLHLPTVQHAASAGPVDAWCGSTFPRSPAALWNVARNKLPSQRYLFTGHPPAYQAPSLDMKAAAVARGSGRSTALISTNGNAQGTETQEPASLIFHGARQDLEEALRSQGWHGPRYPMTTMYVNAQGQDLKLCKNEGLARDHLRVFELGADTWGIAATRDLTATMNTPGSGHGLTFGHLVDPHIDRERDLVMHDILAARPDAADTWEVLHGVPVEPLGRNYVTDCDVYRFAF